MPPCLPQATVLVTGANGFIGTWICQTLLQSGYFIRGTGRSQYKGNHLKKLFATFGEKFEYVVVEDPTKVRLFWLNSEQQVEQPSLDRLMHSKKLFRETSAQ